MHIPFLQLKKQYLSIQTEIETAIQAVFEKNVFAYDETIKVFESKFADYLNLPYCVACGNGTDALEIILRAMQIQPGDEVIVPANGWISAAETVLLLGATPVFADNHPIYYTIDPEEVISKITERTKAIIPIHLYGLPADMLRLKEIADHYQIKLIEDCAQSHGATINGVKTGTFGDAAAFSFYPTKNLGAYGDAGAIVTHDEELAEKCRMIANHGQKRRDDHQLLGRNSRMDTLQAAALNIKLKYLDAWNEQRNKNAILYKELLKDADLILPSMPPQFYSCYHLFVVRVQQREKVRTYLVQKGINTAIHYPIALPAISIFEHLSLNQADYPHAIQQAEEILSLPIYPELTTEEIQYVAETLKACLK